MNIRALIVPVAAGVALLAAQPASADPAKCSRTIVKQYGKYVALQAKVLDKCKYSVITTGVPPALGDCDGISAAKIAQYAQKLRSKIDKKCGGSDRVCNGVGDDSLASINWNTNQCMGLDLNCRTIAINDCSDIADCLICIGDYAVAHGVNQTLYDEFNGGVFYPNNTTEADRAANKCQVAAAKHSVKFFRKKTRALNKCWDKKVNGKDGFDDMVQCPDTDPTPGSGNPPAMPGDNKTVEKIKKLEQKKIASICRACGAGGDSNKDGVCDDPPGVALADVVQTPFTCPAVRVPPTAVHPTGVYCGSINVTDLQSYIDCIDCVIESRADCVTDAGVGDGTPSLGISYPYQCSGTD